MNIKEAINIVAKKHDGMLICSYEFQNEFVIVLSQSKDVITDICMFVCVNKDTSDIYYTNVVGLDMKLKQENVEPTIYKK